MDAIGFGLSWASLGRNKDFWVAREPLGFMSRHGFSLSRPVWLCLGFPIAIEHLCVAIEFFEG